MKKWIAIILAGIMAFSLAACSDSNGSTDETTTSLAKIDNSSSVAKYWRIRTGINQSDCALSTEVDLALALENCDQVSNVDFETVWGQGHTMAERTGSSTDNFIAWINTCKGRI